MIKSVPLLDLESQYQQLKLEIHSALNHVLEQQQFILGAEVSRLEEEIAKYHKCRFAIGVSSGTDALLVALMALDIKPGDEVITTPYSFFSTAGCIARLGAIPVFVDIDPITFNIDINDIRSVVTKKTKAIIVVHLFGLMVNMEQISEIAREMHFHVIEDAAQAIGAEYNGVKIGSLSDIACLSFFPSKNLGGYGDGGMIVTNNEIFAEKIQLLRNHGFPPNQKYNSKILGGNFRLDNIQAAILRVKLKYLDRWTELRQINAQRYVDELVKDNFAELQRPDQTIAVKSKSSIRLSDYSSFPVRHVYNQFIVRVSNRSELIMYLKSQNIGHAIYYPKPLHLQPSLSHFGYSLGDYPESELASEETLALPIYPELSQQQISYVCNHLRIFYKQ